MHGFLLGLANGTTCLFTCAPVLVPYLLSEGKNTRQNMFIVCQFLMGRLIGYLTFAILAYCVSSALSLVSLNHELLFGTAYTLLAIVLFLYSKPPKTVCTAHSLKNLPRCLTENHPLSIPLILGFLTGINLCPPFLLVFTEAVDAQNLWQILLYFLTFFLGTALYFLPIPFMGLFNKTVSLKTIGRLATLLLSAYYLYTGLIMILGGIKTV